MAIKKNASKVSEKETVKEIKKDVPVKEKAKKAAVEVEIEVEDEEAEVLSTNPADYTYLVKLDRAKFPGRDMEQVEAIVFGALGVNKKITIEKED